MQFGEAMIVRGLKLVFSFPIIDTIVWWRQGRACGSAAVSRLLELGPRNRTREGVRLPQLKRCAGGIWRKFLTLFGTVP